MNTFTNLSPEDTVYLLKLPYHLAHANMVDELCTLLTDFDFIDHKISTSTPQLLIEDYNLAIQIHIPQLTQNNLQLIQSAIQLSANILTENHTQLAGQLLGRLLSYETPEIQTLLQQAKQYKGSPWLRPLISSLTNPDASKAVSVASDRTLKIWDLHTGGAIASFTADSTLLTCTVAPENTTIVAGDILGCVHFLRLEDIDGVKEE